MAVKTLVGVKPVFRSMMQSWSYCEPDLQTEAWKRKALQSVDPDCASGVLFPRMLGARTMQRV
jgi:hypothetical protein